MLHIQIIISNVDMYDKKLQQKKFFKTFSNNNYFARNLF